MKFPSTKIQTRLFQSARVGALSASVLLTAVAAHAQTPQTIYTTDFNTDNYTTVMGVAAPSAYTQGSLSDSPATADAATQWKTNDESTNAPLYTVGQSDFVGELTGYSATGNNVAFVGGQYGNAIRPGTPNVYDYRTVNTNTTLAAISATGVAPILGFNVDVAISHSTSPHTGSDTFGWSFQNTAGTTLFSVRFTPSTTQGAGTLLNGKVVGATVYNVSFYNSAGNKFGGNANNNVAAISTDALYHLSINAYSDSGGLGLSLTPSAGGNTTSASALDATDISLTSLESVARVSATWLIADTSVIAANGGITNAGTNSLIFDNYTITGVPEPSTWMMLGLGATGLLVRFRRKARA